MGSSYLTDTKIRISNFIFRNKERSRPIFSNMKIQLIKVLVKIKGFDLFMMMEAELYSDKVALDQSESQSEYISKNMKLKMSGKINLLH